MAGTVGTLQANFLAVTTGMRQGIRQIQKDMLGIGTSTEKAVNQSNKSLDRLSATVTRVEKQIEQAGDNESFNELNRTLKASQQEFQATGRIGSSSMKAVENAVEGAKRELASMATEGIMEMNALEAAIHDVERELNSMGNVVHFPTGDVDNFNRSLRDTDDTLGRVNWQAVDTQNAMDKLRQKVLDASIVGRALGMGLAGLAPAAVPALASATSGAMGLVSALGAATAGAAGFGVVAIPTLTKVFEGYKAINDAQKKVDEATSPEERKKALEELKQAYAGMNGEQLKAVKALQSFTSYFDKLRTEFEKPVLGIFIQGLNTLKTVLDLFKPTIDASVQAVQNLMNSLNRSLQTKDVEAFFGFLSSRAGPALENFGRMAGNVLRGVMNLMVLFSGEGKTMEQGLLRLTERFAEWTSNLGKTQGFKDFIQYAKENTPVLLGTLKNLWDILKNVTVALAPLGADLLKLIGSLTGIASKVTEVASAFSKWEGFEAVVYGIAGAIAAYTIVTKAQAAATKTAAAAQLLWNTLMTLNPIGLIVAALVGLGVAFVAAYKHSETFRGFINKLWDAIKNGATFVLNFFKNNWQTILVLLTGPVGIAVGLVIKYWDQIKSGTITAFNAVINFFKQWGPLLLAALGGPIGLAVYAVVKHWDSIKSKTIEIFNAVKDAVVNALTKAKDLAVAIVQNFVTNVKNDWNNLKNNTISIYNSVKDFIVSAFTWIRDTAIKIVQAYINQVKSNWNALKNATVTIYNGIKTFLSNLWTSLKNTAIKAAQALWNGVKSQWNALKNGTTQIFNATKKFLTDLWNGIKNFITKAAQATWNNVKNQWNALKNGTVNIFNSVRKFLSDLWSGIKNTVTKLAGSAKDGVVNAWTSLRNRTTEMFQNIKKRVTSIFDDIVGAAKKLPGRIGDGIKSMAGGVKKGVKSFANTLVKAMGKGLNGAIDGINWVLEKVDAPKIKKWEIPEYAKGTKGHKGGLAILGDGGEHELYRTPSGQVGLSPNTDTLMNLPKGTEVLSGKQTKEAMAAIPMYKKGTNKLADGAKAVGGWVKDKAGDAVSKGGELLEHAGEKTKKVASKAKDLALDVWDYMDKPVDLMKKVFAKFIPDLPKLGSAAGYMLKGGVKKAKDSSIDFIKSKLDAFMSTSDGGGDGSTVGPGSGKGGMHPYVEAWYNKVKDKFGPTKFMGGYNNRNVRGGSSKSMHAYGRAFDIGGSAKTMSKIAEWARTHMNNLQYAIYNRRIAGPGMGKPWRKYTGQNPHTDHVHLDFMTGGGGGGKSGPSGKGAERWRSSIKKAAAQMKEKLSASELNGIIAQIHRESKGDQGITQDPRVNDINARTGNLAKGLLQYVPSTFRAYALRGHSNIMSGYDQLLAFFNNTSWRKDLPYGRRGWGPRGNRKYKNGTGLLGHLGGDGIMGDGNKREPFLLPNGLMGLSPAISTLFQDLPKGTVVWDSIQSFLNQMNNGASSILGSNMPSVDLSGISSAASTSTTSNSTAYNGPLVQIEYHGTGSKADAKEFIDTVMPVVEKRLIKKIQTDSYKRGMKKG